MQHFPSLHWVYYFLFTRTTLRLHLLVLVGILPAAFLMATGFDSPAFLVGFASTGLLLADIIVGRICRPRLAVVGIMPARVERGSFFETRYKVRNTGRRAARGISVESLIFYDTLRLRLSRPVLDYLAPGVTEVVTGRGFAAGRGVYSLPALCWDSDFPLGLWRWGSAAEEQRRLVVYPRYHNLESLDLPLGWRNRHELAASAELTREAFEFAGCREYREGDALRHVHPRSSARIGAPVVKEFQSEGRARTAILVDTRESWLPGASRLLRDRSRLEAALSLTAALVEALSTTDRVVELLIAGPDIYRFVSAGRQGYLEEALDILAGIEACWDDPIARLQPILLDEIGLIQSVCLVLTRWDECREKLVEGLEQREVGLKVILITSDGRPPVGLPAEVRCVGVRAVLHGEVLQV